MSKCRVYLSTILLSVLAAGLTFVITYSWMRNTPVQRSGGNLSEATQKAAEVQNLIDTYFVGDYDKSEIPDAVAEALVTATGDRWSYYISRDDMQAYQESSQNAYVGIGVVVSVDEEAGGLRVKELTKGGPAELAGMLPDDVITHIEDASTLELGLEESKQRIRGEAGTSVRLTVLRNGVSQDFTVQRGTILQDVVTYALLEDGIGYIAIDNFEQNCAAQSIAAVEDLLAQGAQSLLFDVRFNPGGYKRELCTLLDYLLPEGVIFQSVDYRGEEEIIRSNAACVALPMAVLINEDSYSAAEFFAAALQEYGVASVIGMKTCGKGYYQITYPLSDGSAVAISSGKYRTPNGVSLAGVGVTPDYEIPLGENEYYALYYDRLEAQDDPQLQTACTILRGGTPE